MTATEPITNRWLQGNYAPVSEERTELQLGVTGTIPAELDGRYLRNGPNPVDADPATYHWFTGFGMVHGIRLRGGKAEWYRNRYVRVGSAVDVVGAPAQPNPHPVAADRPIFAANTNAIGLAGSTWAIVEAGGAPVEMTYELDTIGPSDFGGTLPMAFSAHPKRDPRTGDLHTMTYWWGWGNQVQYVRVGADGLVKRTVDIPTPGQSMIHDTAFTERYVIVLDLPCVFDLDVAMAGASLPYTWRDDYQARIGLLPMDGGAEDVVWCEIDPCYIFHPLNAYDTDDGRVVFDAVRHPKMFDQNRLGPDEGKPSFDRWTLDPASGKAIEECLDDRGQEFPRPNEERQGRFARFGYAAEIKAHFEHGGLIKHDLVAGTSQVRDDEGGRYAHGEAVFIPREGGTDEDDGWLMGLRYDRTDDRSDLVILSAQDIAGDPVATVHLPTRVPFGFHGNWVPDA